MDSRLSDIMFYTISMKRDWWVQVTAKITCAAFIVRNISNAEITIQLNIFFEKKKVPLQTTSRHNEATRQLCSY